MKLLLIDRLIYSMSKSSVHFKVLRVRLSEGDLASSVLNEMWLCFIMHKILSNMNSKSILLWMQIKRFDLFKDIMSLFDKFETNYRPFSHRTYWLVRVGKVQVLLMTLMMALHSHSETDREQVCTTWKTAKWNSKPLPWKWFILISKNPQT